MANVGGQAVLEGVMMRGPGNWAVAVRTPTGEIAQVSRPINSAQARHIIFRLPVVRGVIALGGKAMGLVALGGISIGLISLGGLALGAIAMGGLAAGGVAVGGLSAGALVIDGRTRRKKV